MTVNIQGTGADDIIKSFYSEKESTPQYVTVEFNTEQGQ